MLPAVALASVSGFKPPVQRRKEVAAFVRVWRRATVVLRGHPDEAFGIIAAACKRSPEKLRGLAKLDPTLGRRGNEPAFSFAGGLNSLHGAVRQVDDYPTASGITDQKPDNPQCPDGSFIRALK